MTMDSTLLRSMPASSDVGSLSSRRQYSSAKFGAGEWVARTWLMSRSQDDGRLRKSSGDIACVVEPITNTNMYAEISPMSWCCGSQLTKISPPPKACALAMTLAWLTMTPLGSLVEPEVYCRKNTG